MTTAAWRLGVLVPCRNEAAVVERKLANLAGVRWPGEGHRVLVVDDGSEDETAALAARAAERGFPPGVRAEVVANGVRPGKAGALAEGVARLEGEVDLIVLTDADVVLEQDALVELALRFGAPSSPGMVTGAQRFVRALADDGSATAPGGAPAEPAAGWFDRITARVRAFESEFGRLFSVHGQLLAWRADLGLAPTPGVAADDIDLMLQVRRAGRRVEQAPAARFLEVKTPPGRAARDQALRRARAYVQVVRFHERPLRGALADELQWWFYRHVPLWTPRLVPAALAVAGVSAWLAGGPLAFGVFLAALLAVSLLPTGRRLWRLLGVIERAVRLERGGTLSDRWEMARP